MKRRYQRWRRNRPKRGLRKASEVAAVAALTSGAAAGAGSPIGWTALGIIVIVGSLLAIAQHGHGHRRASSLLVIGALIGVAAGRSMWPPTGG